MQKGKLLKKNCVKKAARRAGNFFSKVKRKLIPESKNKKEVHKEIVFKWAALWAAKVLFKRS